MSSFPKELCIAINAPLNDADSEKQTYGCRQSNPDICGYSYIENVCAFASADHICRHPSAKWKKIYNKLKENNQ